MNGADLGGRKILVVEDGYLLATDTARALQSAGAEITALCSSEERAWRNLQQRRPDAVVLDINLGPGPSYKLAATLQDLGIPFVFVTGYDLDVIPGEFSHVERLEKPVEPRRIVSAIAKVLKPMA